MKSLMAVSVGVLVCGILNTGSGYENWDKKIDNTMRGFDDRLIRVNSEKKDEGKGDFKMADFSIAIE